MGLFSSTAVQPICPENGLIKGEINRFSKHYANQSIILFGSGADPFISFDDEWFYYTHTTGTAISLWRAKTLTGLATSKPKVVMDAAGAAGHNFKNVWAPELHKIDGRWYIYYTADDGRNEHHRIYVLESLTADPFGEWKILGRLTTPSSHWAIDATTFCDSRGRRYLLWSGWTRGEGQRQSLFIAEMSGPAEICSDEKRLSQPQGKWEGWINEGPQVLTRDGQVSVIYSGNGWWTRHYALGSLKLEGKDPLAPKSWRKSPDPIFASDGVLPRTLSVGHSSFIHSDGNQDGILVYHALTSPQKREVRAQHFSWSGKKAVFGSPLPPMVAPVESIHDHASEEGKEAVSRSA